MAILLAPFFSVALGIIIFHEPISRKKAVSTLLAFGAVIALIIFSSHLNHWTYFIISTTWGAYTYVKKSTSLGAVSGLLIETLFLTLCLTVATLAFNLPALYPGEIFAPSNNLIWLAGAVSTAPLLMLSYSAGKIPLSPYWLSPVHITRHTDNTVVIYARPKTIRHTTRLDHPNYCLINIPYFL